MLEFLRFLMADVPRKRSRVATLSEHRLYPNIHCKRYAKKTSFDLQKDLMHPGVHISSSQVLWDVAYQRLVERLRTTGKAASFSKNEKHIRMGKKHKYRTVENWKKCRFQMKVIFSFKGNTTDLSGSGRVRSQVLPISMRW